jgi:membrane-associated protease RseP (regulator of RpoE activity)
LGFEFFPYESSEAFDEIQKLVQSEFNVIQGYIDFGIPTFIIAKAPTKEPFRNLVKKMKVKGYIPKLKKSGETLVIRVKTRPSIKPSRWEVNLLLFLITVVSVLYSGYLASTNPVLNEIQGGSNIILQTIIFCGAVFAIVGLHEFGHLIASLLRGKDVTLPYFIPGLPPIGTFGAVIMQKEPLINRDEMFDVGSSGPIVGFIITAIIAFIGLQEGFSFTVSNTVLESLIEKYPGAIGGVSLPILLQSFISLRPIMPDHTLILGPLAYTAYVGAFLTYINLLPAWQLDGGWISLSVLGEKWHRILSWVSVVFLALFGAWLMALLIFLGMRQNVRATPLDEMSPLSNSRKLMAVVCLIIFILCFSVF